jgi:hypothetical protein
MRTYSGVDNGSAGGLHLFQAARAAPGGTPWPARSWRSSSEAAWLETPAGRAAHRGRSAARAGPGTRRRHAAPPRELPRPPRPAPGTAVPGAARSLVPPSWPGTPTACRGRAARRSIMETATRNAPDGTAATTRPQGSAGPGRGWPPDFSRHRPRAPRWATTAAGDDPELLVALSFAGGHDAGQVDADGDGPGHGAGLAVLGGGVTDVVNDPAPAITARRTIGSASVTASRRRPELTSRLAVRPVPDGRTDRPRPGAAWRGCCRAGTGAPR